MDSFRNFIDVSSDIKDLYKNIRSNQTYDFATNMVKKYCTNMVKEINVWDAFEKLNNFVYKSDPDINIANLHHAFQTAEKARACGEPDWFVLVALIHDLGKMLYVKGEDKDGTTISTQYAVVGDTHITGCLLPDELVMNQYNELCPDMKDERYNSVNGVYSDNCGFDNCVFSFGHDEYLYQVLLFNKLHNPKFNLKLPHDALYIMRYHSFYPWHGEGAYVHLASQNDLDKRELLKRFSSYDLYTKCNVEVDYTSPELKNYYPSLIDKYIGTNDWLF